MESKWSKNNLIGLVGTLVFHAIVFVLLLIFGFSTELPLPGEKGVEINLGYYDQGTGEVQPKKPASKPATSQSSQNQQPEEVATQRTEDAPVISETSQNQQSDQTTNTDNQRQSPEESQVNERLLFPGNAQTEGGSEGNTGKQGDQGKPDGSPDASRHEGTSGGNGGPNYKLSGRYAKSLPEPSKNFQEQGKVVVKIWVNQEGLVTRAEPGQKGSTTTDSKLYSLAKQAALRSSFSKKNDAPDEQTGTITYYFVQGQ